MSEKNFGGREGLYLLMTFYCWMDLEVFWVDLGACEFGTDLRSYPDICLKCDEVSIWDFYVDSHESRHKWFRWVFQL